MAIVLTTFSPRCCCYACQPFAHLLSSSALTYRDLKNELLATIVRLESVKNRGELVGIEFDCVSMSAPINLSTIKLLGQLYRDLELVVVGGRIF